MKLHRHRGLQTGHIWVVDGKEGLITYHRYDICDMISQLWYLLLISQIWYLWCKFIPNRYFRLPTRSSKFWNPFLVFYLIFNLIWYSILIFHSIFSYDIYRRSVTVNAWLPVWDTTGTAQHPSMKPAASGLIVWDNQNFDQSTLQWYLMKIFSTVKSVEMIRLHIW